MTPPKTRPHGRLWKGKTRYLIPRSEYGAAVLLSVLFSWTNRDIGKLYDGDA